MRSLYTINNELLELFNTIEDNDGELTEELECQLAITESDLQDKALAYHSVIKKEEAFIGSIDDEIKRLQALKKRSKALKDKLSDNLLRAVELFGDIELETLTVTTRKSTAVEVSDVNQLPDNYKVVKVTEQADKAAIKKDLKAGVQIDGCQLIENKSLKIK